MDKSLREDKKQTVFLFRGCLFESPHIKAEYVITVDKAVLFQWLHQIWLEYTSFAQI